MKQSCNKKEKKKKKQIYIFKREKIEEKKKH
jgi:hypothetical protein